jgi:hypothetical protein
MNEKPQHLQRAGASKHAAKQSPHRKLTARGRSTYEQVIDEIHHVGDVDLTITIGVPGPHGIRR